MRLKIFPGTKKNCEGSLFAGKVAVSKWQRTLDNWFPCMWNPSISQESFCPKLFVNENYLCSTCHYFFHTFGNHRNEILVPWGIFFACPDKSRIIFSPWSSRGFQFIEWEFCLSHACWKRRLNEINDCILCKLKDCSRLDVLDLIFLSWGKYVFGQKAFFLWDLFGTWG